MPKKTNLQALKYLKSRDRKFWLITGVASIFILILTGLAFTGIGNDPSQPETSQNESVGSEQDDSDDENDNESNTVQDTVIELGPTESATGEWGDPYIFRLTDSFDTFYVVRGFSNPSVQSGICRFEFIPWGSKLPEEQLVREVQIAEATSCRVDVPFDELDQRVKSPLTRFVLNTTLLDSNRKQIIPWHTHEMSHICFGPAQDYHTIYPACRNEDGTKAPGKPYLESAINTLFIGGSSIDNGVFYVSRFARYYHMTQKGCSVEIFADSVLLGDTGSSSSTEHVCSRRVPLDDIPGLIGGPGTTSAEIMIRVEIDVTYEAYGITETASETLNTTLQCSVGQSNEDRTCSYGSKTWSNM